MKIVAVGNNLAEVDKTVVLGESFGSLLAFWYVDCPFVQVLIYFSTDTPDEK